ncbi:hypothetical protein JFP838_pA0288 (plasmid) [Clostridium perfringens]|uniref:Uncharacterized protein n=1 Tax=Clostridium perfringens TaxID=1502 RepID=A0A140GRP5_CLOPF|nr:hypothetical protein JFP838_pA0288 [Clostridium perfringens]
MIKCNVILTNLKNDFKLIIFNKKNKSKREMKKKTGREGER